MAVISVLLISIISIMIGIVTKRNGKTIVDILYGKEYRSTIRILEILSLSAIIASISLTIQWIVMAIKGTSKLNIYMIILIIVKVIICTSLIKSEGAIGAAKGNLISEFFVMIGCFFILISKLKKAGLYEKNE